MSDLSTCFCSIKAISHLVNGTEEREGSRSRMQRQKGTRGKRWMNGAWRVQDDNGNVDLLVWDRDTRTCTPERTLGANDSRAGGDTCSTLGSTPARCLPKLHGAYLNFSVVLKWKPIGTRNETSRNKRLALVKLYAPNFKDLVDPRTIQIVYKANCHQLLHDNHKLVQMSESQEIVCLHKRTCTQSQKDTAYQCQDFICREDMRTCTSLTQFKQIHTTKTVDGYKMHIDRTC